MVDFTSRTKLHVGLKCTDLIENTMLQYILCNDAPYFAFLWLQHSPEQPFLGGRRGLGVGPRPSPSSGPWHCSVQEADHQHWATLYIRQQYYCCNLQGYSGLQLIWNTDCKKKEQNHYPKTNHYTTSTV